jgi:small subunit ribosomal protein S21
VRLACSSIGEQPGSWKISGAVPDYAANLNIDMLRVIVKDGDNIEKALKQFKRKVMNTKLIKEQRERQEFQKPSVTRRKKKLKARYIQQLKNAEE